MKSFLLASAAAIALVVAPIAAAQYTSPAPSAPPSYSAPQAPNYTTPQTEPGYTLPGNSLEPQAADPAAPPMVQAAPPAAYDTPNVAAAQPDAATAEAETPDAVNTAEADAPATMSQASEAEVTLAAMQEHARDAGMEALPMSAAQMCAPRTVDFEQTRLDRDARHQLIAAVDRASVCEMREVTIKAPESRAAAVRRQLVASGVEDGMITVEPAAAGELEVDMAFNGIAASTPEYAAMFNSGTQVAALDESAPEQMNAPADQSYAPTTYAPMPSEAPSDRGDEVYNPTTAL